jgi:hypothetical protein
MSRKYKFEFKPENLSGDFKRFTSRKIIQAIIDNPKESREEWLHEQFKKAADQCSNVNNYQFWRHDTKPNELWINKVIAEKINYLHSNPCLLQVSGCSRLGIQT